MEENMSSTQEKLRYFSMFSGIGGFELGIQRAFDNRPNLRDGLEDIQDSSPNTQESQVRAECVGYSEIDKYAIATYQQHFGGHRNYGDATKINAGELPDFDLLVGGFPCQAFSVAGKRKGFDDTRGTLFFDIARILSEKRPRHLVLENVKGLLSHDSGKTFQTIIGVLTDLGYFVEWQVLNSKDFGVPQNRERVFIVGHLGGEPSRKVFPITGTAGQNIQSTKYGIRQHHAVYSREGLSPTLTSASDPKTTKSHNGYHVPKLQPLSKQEARIRRLTPLECERLQGFPDNWTVGSDTQRYKQCGNAVTVNVVEAVIYQLEQSEESK